MRLELHGHHVDVTPGLRKFVEQKLTKLERMLSDRAVSAQAILRREKRRHLADITLHARGERFLHGLGESGNWETSLTRAIAAISQQAQKLKSRQKETRHRLKAPALDGADPIARSTAAAKAPTRRTPARRKTKA